MTQGDLAAAVPGASAPVDETSAAPRARRPARAPLHRTLCWEFQSTAAAFAGDVALRTPGGELELTWGEYSERVESFARGLAGLGVAHGDTVALMLVNRPEFHVLDTAAFHLGAAPFSIYNTSTVEQIAYVMEHAGCRVAVTERAFLEQMLAARATVAALEHVVVIDAEAEGTLSLAELEASGRPGFDFERVWQSVAPGDLATLIYTSGTTGPPKGAMLSHANLVAAWDASVAAVPLLARRGRYVSYLPTAHLADRVFSHYPAIVNGSSITCVDDPRAAVGLLGTIRPTAWLAVPRIWEKLKDGIEAVVDSVEHSAEIRAAIALGLERVRAEQSGRELAAGSLAALEQADERYLAAIRSRIGLDEVELLVSGAAPIREDVLEFFAALGLPICEGYGMTECTAVATLNRPGEQRLGTVGRPVPGVELRLADDGEILVRGPGVMAGYRGEPDKTAEAIDAAGWLHTGDVGALDRDGYLRIIDRKKELIINAAGKNMSPANIEARLKAASPLIGHAIAIGDRRPYNTALIVLDPDALGLYAYRNGIEDAGPASMATDERVVAEIAAAVEEANSHLSRVEQIKRCTVLPDDWQPGSDVLTPTLKLRRKPIADRYASEIEAMYKP